MKAIPSSSSPPPPSSLRSSRSYSSLTGGHASSACFHRRRLGGGESRVKFVVVMAKKKNPPSSSSSSSSSHQASDSTPPRITSNVKQNLQFLKLWKEFQKRNSSIPKPATSYRRKKLPKEDLPDDDMELYGDPTLALYQDAWIEKEVVALKEDGCPRVWVVTSDRCQQQAAHGAGAFIWSCKALVSEIKTSLKEVERMLQEQRTSSFQGKLLKHNLDSEVVDALKDLRKQLSENELRNS